MTISGKLHSEKAGLDEKIGKLSKFLLSVEFVSLTGLHKELLYGQLKVMKIYSEILRDRIIDIEGKNNG